jgi:hypothetical protein
MFFFYCRSLKSEVKLKIDVTIKKQKLIKMSICLHKNQLESSLKIYFTCILIKGQFSIFKFIN